MNHLVILRRLPKLSRCVSPRLAASPGIHWRHMSSDTDFKPSEELAKERYDLRSNEDIERKRARLLYQSRKRGMLENGVILASFADKYLSKLDADHLDQYDRLINLPTNDWDIYYWATKTKPTPAEFETPVLEMLRQHLKSKVSNEEKLSESVLGKSNLDDIVMPASRNYDLEIDVQKVDLTNYQKELFDDRIKRLPRGDSISLMSAWRKKQLEHRLKRAVSQPTSLASLSTDSNKKKYDQVYTQLYSENDICNPVVVPNDLIDSEYEKYMKHHDFLQHFLANSNLTDDPLEYDDEAEAWAAMLWHRNYGSDDDLISPIKDTKCNTCRAVLQCCDPALEGYVPRQIYVSIDANEKLSHDSLTCQPCKFTSVYKAKLSHEMNPSDYNNYLRHIAKDKSAIFIVLLDLTDFPGSVWKDTINLIDGWNKRLIIVGNKVDLLPYDGSKILNRVAYCLRKNLSKINRQGRNLFISDLTIISARTGFGIAELVGRIMKFSEEEPKNVYILGSNNTGKSTLFSALLQSDLCATRESDIISRVSRYQVPASQIKMLQFPINPAEGWEVEMKQRRVERRERNTEEIENSLKVLTKRRRESMPHISTLINRLDYVAADDNNAIILRDKSEHIQKPNFSPDHPLANLKDPDPMSANRDKFDHHGFCFQTPSPINPDQLHDLLTNDERLEVFPNETMVPRKYSLRPLQTIFIAGLARLDLLTSQSNVIFTVFASKYLPVHVIQTRKADKFYNQFLGSPYLGVPFGSNARLAAWPDLANSQPDFLITSQGHSYGCADVVLGSAGWALVDMTQDQECLVRAYTPEGRGIFLRDPPLLSKSRRLPLGSKIRDTPVFKNPNYKIQTQRFD